MLIIYHRTQNTDDYLPRTRMAGKKHRLITNATSNIEQQQKNTAIKTDLQE